MIWFPSQKIRLLLTHKCNANCFYCHREGLSESFEEKINAEFVKKLLSLVKCREVALSGGEPTLHPQIEEICKEIKKQGKHLSLNTNGTQLEVMQKIAPYLDEAHVSFDSPNEKVYRHIKKLPLQNPLKTISLCKKSGIAVKINVPLSQSANLDEMVSFAKKEDVELRFVEILSKGLDKPAISSESIEKKLKQAGFTLQKAVDGRNHWTNNSSKVITLKCVCRDAANSDSVEEAAEICKTRTNLYVTPSGNLKPCLLSNETIPLYEHLMNENNSKALASIKAAVSMLGCGKCIQTICLKNKAKALAT